ncbi:MAG: c-type cytochrome [Methylococcaceae bacterium]|nr:c-type cytochrome [Methylococcaceae bacterium]
MNKKAMTLVFALIALLSFQTFSQAADIQAGKDAFETCRGCHSAPSYSNVYPTYYVPKIGGQVAAYTVSALKAYKESKRSHRTMMANSFDLSEQKMEDIAAFLAEATGGSKETKSNHGDITRGKKLAETCLSCHNDDTSSSNPRLAGQHANYLEKAMQDYQSEKRKNPLMKSMVEDLSEDDIRDISAYFSNLKGLVATE